MSDPRKGCQPVSQCLDRTLCLQSDWEKTWHCLWQVTAASAAAAAWLAFSHTHTHYLPTCLLISASLGRRSLGVQCSERPAITNNYLAAFNTHRATLCECTLLCELPLLPHQRPPIDITNIACDTSLCKSHTDAERPQPDLPHHLLLAIYSR